MLILHQDLSSHVTVWNSYNLPVSEAVALLKVVEKQFADPDDKGADPGRQENDL